MSLSPVTMTAVRPAFTAKQNQAPPQVLPANVSAEALQTPQPKYLQPYKPGFFARAGAVFVGLKETTKGAIAGMLYGTAVGAPAAAAAMLVAKTAKEGLKNTKLGKLILGTAVVGGTLAGAFVGKKKVSDSLKGAGTGFLYGAAGGTAAAATGMIINSLGKGNMGKGVLAAAIVVNTIIGAFVGKLRGNQKTGEVYDMFGRAKWSTGK
jgi:hypothetical protein